MQRTASLPAVDAGPGRCRHSTPRPRCEATRDPVRRRRPRTCARRSGPIRARCTPAHQSRTAAAAISPGFARRGEEDVTRRPRDRRVIDQEASARGRSGHPSRQGEDSSAGRNTECRVERKGRARAKEKERGATGTARKKGLGTIGRLDLAGTRRASLAGDRCWSGWPSVQASSRCRNVSREESLSSQFKVGIGVIPSLITDAASRRRDPVIVHRGCNPASAPRDTSVHRSSHGKARAEPRRTELRFMTPGAPKCTMPSNGAGPARSNNAD